MEDWECGTHTMDKGSYDCTFTSLLEEFAYFLKALENPNELEIKYLIFQLSRETKEKLTHRLFLDFPS